MSTDTYDNFFGEKICSFGGLSLKGAAKATLKNDLIFESILYLNKNDFRVKLFELINEYGRKKEPPGTLNFPLRQNNEQCFKEYLDKCTKNYEEIAYWDPKDRFRFIQSIDDLLASVDLGSEWRSTMLTAICDQWVVPPAQNFSIAKKGKDGKQRIVLELSPSTSLLDIKNAWSLIKHLQKEVWPSYKKKNLSLKVGELREIALADLRKRTTSVDGLCSDATVVADIWENADNISRAADKKRKNRLRQIRKRFREA